LKKLSDVVKAGDKVKALIMSIDKADKKIALSKKNADNADLSQFTQAETKTSALAEKLKGFSVKE
jgi:ribosomal protein S1